MANSPPTTTTECLIGCPKPKEAPPPDRSGKKKVRDLPELSVCHGCSCRIDHSNPKKRLQLLDSFWRVVLLCKKCIKKVNNGELCTYCLKDASKLVSDCFTCGNCCHLVHKNCIVNYENSPPWCYNTSKLLCIDCWLPDRLKKSFEGKKKEPKKRGKKVVVVATGSEKGNCSGSGDGGGGDGVGDDGGGSGGRSEVDVAKKVKCAFEKKVTVALKAKTTALRKALLERKALESAKNASDFLVTKCENGGGGSGSGGGRSEVDVAKEAICLLEKKFIVAFKEMTTDLRKVVLERNAFKSTKNALDLIVTTCENGGSRKVVNDAEFVLQLHHARNSSPRGSKNRKANGSCTLTDSGVVTFKCSDRKRKELQRSGTEATCSYTSTDSDTVKPEIKVYKRHTWRMEECEPSVLVTNGSFTCDVKEREDSQSGLDANGSCNLTEFSGLKPEMYTSDQNDGNRKELQRSGVDANGSDKEGNIELKECQLFTVDAKEGCDGVHHDGLIAEVNTYKRNKRKRNECEEFGEQGNLGNGDGSITNYTDAEKSSLVRESQTFWQDKSKEELCGDDGRSSTPVEGHSSINDGAEDRFGISVATAADVFTQDESGGNTYSDHYALKYSRRKKASGIIFAGQQ